MAPGRPQPVTAATELGRVEVEGGAIGHAEARIGDSIIMMFDLPFPVPTPGLLRLYVADADAVFARAVAAGATVVTRLTELARRFQDPKYAEALQYVQSTLAAGLDAA